MPGKTLHNEQLNQLQKKVGTGINVKNIQDTLVKAWEDDKSKEKLRFLDQYRKTFKNVLKTWLEKDITECYISRENRTPNITQILSNTDKYIKTATMSLIPEIVSDENLVNQMTFGFMQRDQLVDEITSVTNKHSNINSMERNIYGDHKKQAYNKYYNKWQTEKVDNITKTAFDNEAFSKLSRYDQVNYLIALDEHLKKKYNVSQKDVNNDKINIENAINQCKINLNFDKDSSVQDIACTEYQKKYDSINSSNNISNSINESIRLYNNVQNATKRDIDEFKKLKQKFDSDNEEIGLNDLFDSQQEKIANERKQRRLVNEQKADNTIGEVGNFIQAEDKIVEISKVEENINRYRIYSDSISNFNKEFDLKLSSRVLYDHIEKNTKALIDAKNEKTKYLDKNNVVVIENGKETVYNAKEYFKETPDFADGGIVIVKDGNQTRRYKAQEYFDTHETANEHKAYEEISKLYSKIYKDACANNKQKLYNECDTPNFADIATKTDKLFKLAMYSSNVFEDRTNSEIVQKCAFGGLSSEKLSQIAVQSDSGLWNMKQNTHTAWTNQIKNAKNIYKAWEKEKPNNSNMSEKIKTVLQENIDGFKAGNLPKKVLLDHTIAADALFKKQYKSFTSKLFNLKSYRTEKKAIEECRKAMGIGPKESFKTHMNKEYTDQIKNMKVNEVNRNIIKTVDNIDSFEITKQKLDSQRKMTIENERNKQMRELDEILKSGREPLNIDELNEKKKIVNEKPRSKPVVQEKQIQVNKNLSNK